ncbi:hypothetical protein GOODEAATRI_016971 [Goodea atripinnis]|uniref:TNF receptor-associated factor n=1 Tax=Goodea atripinnis TaxID=208336 RepID=A0ABV0NBI1_9TELE
MVSLATSHMVSPVIQRGIKTDFLVEAPPPSSALSLIENGKLSDHEHSSTMEHLRLLLPMVLSMTRTQSEALGSGEWQEDSGFGLYRAPEEGNGAAASTQPVNALENIVCVLNREVERSSLTLEAFAHQHRLDQEKIENLSNRVRQLERTVTMRDLQLSENEQLVRELQHCTYDGIFVWKITDFSRRRQDALAGRTPAMFSPGKMRFVTLMLLDQNNREHIIDAFRPDITSTSFQRPISEMNIASGCPLFCPLAKLAGKSPYLRDDTIFIKAIVDLTGL